MLQSCSGPEGGAYLRATRGDGVTSLTDAHFVSATRFRLNLPTMEACACQHVTRKGGRLCGERSDSKGHHAMTCKVGGAPYAAHGQGCHILHQAHGQAGFQCKREQIVPEFASSKCPSPQLDLDAWSLQGAERLLVDFTIRHPLAGRYVMCGDATKASEKEKLVDYPARAGLTVVPAAMETYGRHGESLRRLLETLADRARQRDLSFGHAPGRWLKRWRAQLSHAMATFVGRAVQSSETAPRNP